MGKAGEGSSGKEPVDRDTAARLLSVLLTTEDGELESYRRRCIAKDSEIDIARLRAAQELLASIGATLRSTDERAWAQLIAARDLLLEPASASHGPQTAKGAGRPLPTSLPFKAGPAALPRSALPDLPPLPDHAQRATVGLDEDVLSPLARVQPPSIRVPTLPAALPSAALPPAALPPVALPRAPTARAVERPASVQPTPAAAASSQATIEDARIGHHKAVALPFKAGPVVEPPSALPDLPALAPGAQHGTVGLDEEVMSPLARLVLPFAKRAVPAGEPASKRPMPASSSLRPTEDAAERTELLDGPAPTSAQDEFPTTRLPAATIAEAVAAASRLPSPELNVEQYAWLAVRCEIDPASTPALCRQHGIETDEALLALEQLWRERVAADPALRARFEQLVTHYRDWIARRGR
jgi:hypothetical protein